MTPPAGPLTGLPHVTIPPFAEAHVHEAASTAHAECGCADADARAACKSADSCNANGRLTERERLIEAMEKTGWVQAKAARVLNITPRQIGYALRKHGIEMKRF
jgi:transcriptional regulator with GAF, ATPase, and Fis domain